MEGKSKSDQAPILAAEGSVEIKERELQQRMLKFQFEYANRLMKREIRFLNGEYVDIGGFEDIIRNWTRVPIDIRNAYCKRAGKNVQDLKEDVSYKEVSDGIIEKICRQYEETPDLRILSVKAFDIVYDAISVLPEPERQTEENEVGVLRYNIEKSDKDGKDYVDIHFVALFKQQAQKAKEHLTRENLPEEIKNSCKQLARIIKEKYSNVARVMCESWLVDTDWFADTVGFDKNKSILANGTGFTKGNGFWGQFISKTGELKEERLKDLISGKKPKYLAKFNIVPKEEFLKIHAEK